MVPARPAGAPPARDAVDYPSDTGSDSGATGGSGVFMALSLFVLYGDSRLKYTGAREHNCTAHGVDSGASSPDEAAEAEAAEAAAAAVGGGPSCHSALPWQCHVEQWRHCRDSPYEREWGEACGQHGPRLGGSRGAAGGAATASWCA